MRSVLTCGLWGPNPGSKLFSQTNPYTTGPFGISPRSADWSLTQSSMGGCWNQVFAPLRWLWCRFSPTIPTFMQVASRSVPPFSNLTKCRNQLSRSPNLGLRCFCAAGAVNCAISQIRLIILLILLTYLNYLCISRYYNLRSLNDYSYTHSRII